MLRAPEAIMKSVVKGQDDSGEVCRNSARH